MDSAATTIFALASGQGASGIAVIRLSGLEADTVLGRLTGRPPPAPRRAAVRALHDAAGTLLDEALVLRFEAGASYTGETMAELHCHGGRAVVAAVLETLARQPGCRMAEPGEFTRRAFMAGRLDLAEVEALGDLIAAETEWQRRQAVRGLGGALHRQAADWRERLVHAAALIEATIDWADEEVPEDVRPEAGAAIGAVRQGIASELVLSAGAERLRLGLEVALVGAPNSGKSSLFNALARRDAAIVSDRPGTTRDVLELRYDLEGLPVVFLDTAGLRETDDPVEAEGVIRARARAEAAALRLMLDCADAPAGVAERALLQPGDLTVWSKSDLAAGKGHVSVSAATGEGLRELLGRVRTALTDRVSPEGLVGHLRQRQVLEAAVSALSRAENGLEDGEAEAVAEDLRSALRALERLIGRVGVEDVLDAVFATFCLGK